MTWRQGSRGFAEWGFMSTTADKSAAIKYSGVLEGRPKAIVLVITVSAVDRGACIRDLSQARTLTFLFGLSLLHLEFTQRC